MANLIQIKRSLNTATAPSLANGELAFTANGDHLFIGSNGASITIAGKFNPGVLTANQALVANGTSAIDKVIVANLVPTAIYANGSVGTAGQRLTSNGTVAYWETQLPGVVGANTQIQFNDSNSLGSSANLTFNKDTSILFASVVNTNSISVGGGLVANSSRVIISSGAGFEANGAIGTAGQVLHSNGVSVYWANTTADITEVIAGNGLTGGGTSGAVTLNVAAANGINVAADSVGVTTGSTLTVNSTGIHVNSALSITDLTLAGNLTVSGTLTTIDTNNLTIEDPLIKVANGNLSDAVDVGLYGIYTNGGTRYTGLFRDASDSGIYKLFTGLETEPTTTVDTAGVGYGQATLKAYLNSGALTSNGDNLNITANSQIAVSIYANTYRWASLSSGGIIVGNSTNGFTNLSLGTDGYVLQSNGTTVVYGTLDGGTF
jgi:hypothetical protein